MQSEAAVRVAALLGMDEREQVEIRVGVRKPPQSVRPAQLASGTPRIFVREAG
jgi:hypothetical protein